MILSRVETQIGKAWDAWRLTQETNGFLWYIPHGGIQSFIVSEQNPSDNGTNGNHALVSGQNVGWLSREQFMARIMPAAYAVPVLDKNGN